MAAPDDTALKALINSNIPDANPGLPRRGTAAFVRAALFTLIDWVKTAINGNLSTWFKVGTANTPATNAEDVYRTGKMVIGRTNLDATGAALQAESFSLASIPWHSGAYWDTAAVDFDNMIQVGTHCFYGASWMAGGHGPGAQFANVFPFGTAIIFRGAGGSIIQMYIDNSNGFIYTRQKWQTNAWGAWYSPNRPADLTINNTLQFDATISNRKISLYGAGNSDHQFYGFGVNDGKLQYRVDSTGAMHTFYAGLTPATSVELMRIQGDGKIGIGTPAGAAPTYPVDINLLNPAIGVFLNLYNRSTSAQNGALMQFGQKDITTWTIGCLGTESTFLISGWSGAGMSEWMRILGASGFTGFGTTAPTSKMHLKGATGHQQLRLETSYTPTSTADANGQTGQICWDQNYIYVKVAGGWRRAALNSW